MYTDEYKFVQYQSMYAETRWAKKEEMKANAQEICLSDGQYAHAGLPILNDGKTAYVDENDNHSLIFGSTGSKKTRLYVMPTLRILIGAGESYVVTDPKGELYERSSGAAKANGYNVIVLNYRNLLQGDTWNPLALPYKLYHEGDKEGAISRVNDFVNAISANQMSNSKDVFWVNAARSVALAVLLLMLDTCTKEECNLKTFTRFCVEFAKAIPDEVTLKAMSMTKDDFEKNYLQELMQLTPPESVTRLNYEGIASSGEKAKGDIQSTLFTLISIFLTQESLVQNMQQGSFDMEKIGREKTALYLIVPDERTSYHFIATTFIKQCYETLILDAQQSENRMLSVRVNFVLDEFANIPAIPDMPAMISAARSRNIRFFLVLQSMHQMRQKYGEEAQTIKGNCENWIFLSSKELALLEEISSLCGKADKPLISVSQLQRLNKKRGEALVFAGRQYPFITEMADIDDCDFLQYEAVEQKRIQSIDAVSIGPEEMYRQMKAKKRPYPFHAIAPEDTYCNALKNENVLLIDELDVLQDTKTNQISLIVGMEGFRFAIKPVLEYDGGRYAVLRDAQNMRLLIGEIAPEARQPLYDAETIDVVFIEAGTLEDIRIQSLDEATPVVHNEYTTYAGDRLFKKRK